MNLLSIHLTYSFDLICGSESGEGSGYGYGDGSGNGRGMGLEIYEHFTN